MSATEVEIAERYRELALEWASLRDYPKKANILFKKHHAYFKEIRGLPQGQRALRSLLDDAEVPVRLLAATHSLSFAATEAEGVLRQLERGEDVYAMDAKYTLISYRAGNLDLDW